MDSEIRDEFKRINEKLDQLIVLPAAVAEHHRLLFGNHQPGLIKDVDRLKQNDNRRKWFERAGITALFAVVADFVIRFIR